MRTGSRGTMGSVAIAVVRFQQSKTIFCGREGRVRFAGLFFDENILVDL